MWRLGLAAAAFAALLVSRHPEILFRAAFWAEDGALWFPNAREHGLQTLVWPEVGYLQTVSRLGGLLAQALPLRWAPTSFAVLALLIQVAPPVFLVSGRWRAAWPDPWTRWLAALAYVALPNAFEVYVNLTNAQWHLAALGFLIVVADPPRSRAAQVFDGAALLLSGLSGPFCLLLAPIAAWQAWERLDRVALWRLGLVLLAVAVQVGFLMHMVGSGRSTAPLGAGAELLARFLASQVFLAVLFGEHGVQAILALPAWRSGLLPVASSLAGVALGLYACIVGPPILRKACLFAGLVLAAALMHPQVSNDQQQWPLMALPFVGGRYWFFPMLACIGVVLALLAAGPWPGRVVGAALLGIVAWHVPAEWPVWPFGDPTGFPSAARRFEAAPPGTRVSFPSRPQGAHMVLVR